MSGFVCLDCYPEYYFSQSYPTKEFAHRVLCVNDPQEVSCVSIETVDIGKAKSSLYLFYLDVIGRLEYVYVCERGLSDQSFHHGLLEINHNTDRDVKFLFSEDRFILSNMGDSESFDSQGRLIRVSGDYGGKYVYEVKYDAQGRLVSYGPRSFFYNDSSGFLSEIRGDEGYNCSYDYIAHGYGNDTWTHRVEKIQSGRQVLERHTFRRFVKRYDERELTRMENLLYSIKADDNCNCFYLG